MTPDDVYAAVLARSAHTHNLVIAVIVLVSVLLAVAGPASVMFIHQARRFGRILDLAERHGEITDAQTARMREVAKDEFRHLLDVKGKVDRVDDKVTDVRATVARVEETVIKVDGRLPDYPSGTVGPSAGVSHPQSDPPPRPPAP